MRGGRKHLDRCFFSHARIRHFRRANVIPIHQRCGKQGWLLRNCCIHSRNGRTFGGKIKIGSTGPADLGGIRGLVIGALMHAGRVQFINCREYNRSRHSVKNFR